ncbi:MAG: tetratricopeptide repeat protein [Phycisphaerae bacterium]
MNRQSMWVVVCLIAAASGCSKKPTAIVDFTYEIKPKQPLSEQYMKIAVVDARMEVEDKTGEFDQKKWSEMTADLIRSELKRSAERYHIPLELVDREHMKITLGEKDMAAAGITDSGDDAASAALVGANALLTSKVTIKIDKRKGKGRTIDAMNVMAWARGGGGGVHTSEVETESRNITVQCQFQLKDAATGREIESHTGRPSQHFDKARRPSPFFGSAKTEANMDARDQVIGQFVEKQLQQFLCKFMPVEIHASCEVKASSNENCIAGVQSLVVDDYETALQSFKQAIAEKPTDDRALFGAGVACEKLGRLDQALKYYKLARSYEDDEPKYAEAVERVQSMS